MSTGDGWMQKAPFPTPPLASFPSSNHTVSFIFDLDQLPVMLLNVTAEKPPAVRWLRHYLSRYNRTSRGLWTSVARDARQDGIKFENPCLTSCPAMADHLVWKTSSTPTFHCNHHNSHIQPAMIPFVLSVCVEPKGFSSLFTTHATHPPHSPRRRLVITARPGLLQVKWAMPKSPWGKQSREPRATLYLTFMFFLLTGAY